MSEIKIPRVWVITSKISSFHCGHLQRPQFSGKWSHTVLQNLLIFWRKVLFLSLFYYKYGSIVFTQNVGKFLPDNTESHPRRQQSSGQEVFLHSKSMTANNSSPIIINDQKISSVVSQRPAFWPDHGTWPASSLWPCGIGGGG